ncbi:hypothetical protein CDL12_03069 [Handroanthus impetiginosus]|uniref:Uncharacterized protein n=1 Tax=Handroanthus impetiginosus TaxID=429701 RepID=A0A2G9I377_9LAMI|nr:hypothetical protein CDL12_03069 [Handroanthus impetiginosus]
MSHYSSMEEDHQEMQLLSYSTTTPHAAPASRSSHPSDSSTRFESLTDRFEGPSLDLQLSISVTPLKPPNSECVLIRKVKEYNTNDHVKMIDNSSCIEALKWQAAEQIRLATLEKAYAERVMEMTRREMELAQSEFAHARILWERAREEVGRAQKMKEKATQEMDSSCNEITCLSCRHKFRS